MSADIARGDAEGPSLSAGEFSLRFDGAGRFERCSLESALHWLDGEGGDAGGFVWLHVRLGSPALAALTASGVIDPMVAEQLAATDTRPRCIPHEDGVILNLRGRAADPSEDDDPLAALRMWVVPCGLVSTERRALAATLDARAAVERGGGPRSPGELVTRLALRIADTIEPLVDDLSETMDGIEIDGSQRELREARREMSDLRQGAIALRRHLYPQRDAVSTLLVESLPFLKDADRARLHETHERIGRFIDELEVVRERAAVLYDEMLVERGERMNRQMLLLAIVSALFLPATLIAGLFGMNVEGIPLADHPLGFWLVSGAMGVLILAELALFRWLRLI